MPVENATNIPGLVVTNPTSGDGAGSTDDQIRMMKTAVKGSFPSFTGSENITLSEAQINALPQDIVDAVAAIADDLVPVGLISLWSGSLAAIPTNWALCDGSNGTPDLTDRFVVGAGDTYNVGASGGSLSKTTNSSGSHDHGGSTAGHALTKAQMPAHDHGLGGDRLLSFPGGTQSADVDYYSGDGDGFTRTLSSEGSGQTHSHGLSSDGNHSHTLNDVRPPYYALAYIQKVA